MPAKPSQTCYASGGTIQGWAQTKRDEELNRMRDAGAKMVRFDFAWTQIEPSQGAFSYAAHDRAVTDASARGIGVLGMLGYTPAWARPGGTSDKYPPTSNANYATYCAAVVNHFKGAPYNVKHWELWNEANISAFWGGCPATTGGPAKYAAMVQAAYTAMKAADPTCFIVAGGMSPAEDNGCNIDPRTFLQALYANGIKGYFDALAHHPYFGPAPPWTVENWSAWSQMYVDGGVMTKPSLRKIMVDNGEGHKQIWATEFGMLIQNVTWNGFTADETRQAALVKEGYDEWGNFPWAGKAFWYNYQDHDGWSFRRTDGTLRPSYTAYRDYVRAPEGETPPLLEPPPVSEPEMVPLKELMTLLRADIGYWRGRKQAWPAVKGSPGGKFYYGHGGT